VIAPRILAALLAMPVWLASAGAAERPRGAMEILQIEANEGSSSGGHLALRLGPEVYHFQHRDPGLLSLRRDTWERFRYQYGALENRGITRHRIAAGDEPVAALRNDFASLLFIQRKQFAALEDAEQDVALLERLDPGGAPTASMAIAGSGYFSTPPRLDSSAVAECGALVALRRRAGRLYGAGFIAEARRAAVERARSLRYEHRATSLRARHDYPTHRGFARALTDLATEIVALAVLDRGPCLRNDATIAAEAPLGADERARLRRRSAVIQSRLLELLASRRVDKGYPLLVGMARLLALEESDRQGRLVLLDAFPNEARGDDRGVRLRRESVRAALQRRAGAELEQARANFFAGGYDEAKLSALETAATRLAALQAVGSDGRLRTYPGELTPTRAASWTGLPVPAFDAAELAAHRAAARRSASVLKEQIAGLWSYDLLARNCATEIFRQIRNAAPALARRQGASWMEIVPALAGIAVDRSFRVESAERIPSLHERHTRGESLGAAVAESNTLTSRLYADWSSDDDSTFLFFARRPATLRPLFGAANLATGIIATAAGLPLAPFDGGRLITAGARGAAFSVPELLWINIRKGSFAYIENPQINEERGATGS
jgi:hypothetical protein